MPDREPATGRPGAQRRHVDDLECYFSAKILEQELTLTSFGPLQKDVK